jgi:hypothetical protein
MTGRRVATLIGLMALVLPAVVAAQGLGDVAARERAKRDAAKKATEAKVLTNEDLDKGRPPGAAGTGGQAASAPEESSAEAPTSPPMEDRLANERPYLDAIQTAQTRVSEIEQRIQGLQSKLNPMSGSFIYGASGSNSANEEAEVREQLRQAESELTEARQAVVAANQALEESRQGRPSAPPVVE